ncbi:helix-turn-helix transcriptional regulator [Stackebrandtia nassauensis]|uniref:Helix-turn-helix type 11 domain protein n=1 Tax=Stackebrandtia nassauensis (strain DSM 44728 / CIP 108903 / NRRL B-16338 / NBRC 102104 / LLR-40K-21) TaxID=446470 RepID=D3Q7T6_STANL|nr:WYL domain-containing protein [Stackebrandtia nassauensis]ADD44428.1 Helix-turn-helix type 11 domain protein [Stackebrandtia nassauensis DSM 44728]
MIETSSRLLALLALLQSRPHWSGSQLAERLDVTGRTIRNDIDRLRELGYPVDAVRGAGGYYQLGAGAKLPPLLLDDEEAVAVAIGLRAGRGVTGIQESAERALSKLEQVLPHRLRRQVSALTEAVSVGPDDTGTPAPPPDVDAAVLSQIAAAIRDSHLLRFDYTAPDRPDDTPRRNDASAPFADWPVLVEPYRLISWEQHWYLVARGPETGDWHTYRVDWATPRMPTGERFDPVPFPGGDYTAFVLRDVALAGWKVHARITVAAPAEDVLARINPAVGVVEAIDTTTSVLVTGADNLSIIAVYIGMLELDFQVTEPPELVEHVRTLGERYRRAVSP